MSDIRNKMKKDILIEINSDEFANLNISKNQLEEIIDRHLDCVLLPERHSTKKEIFRKTIETVRQTLNTNKK